MQLPTSRMQVFQPFRRYRTAVVCVVLMACAIPRSVAQEVTVIRGGTLIDGTGAPPAPNAVIVVRGDRIEAIGQGITPPAGAQVVDATGKYILPGLWDKHLHYKDWFPELLITNGVTNAFVQDGGPWINAQKEGVEKGKILGPRMFLRQQSIDLWDPVAARKRVLETIGMRADFIKVYTGATPEVVKIAAEEAHKAGLHVEGHLGISARQAVAAGIDGLTHATGIALDIVRPEVLEKIPSLPVMDTGRQRVIFPKISTWDESKVGGPNPDLTEYWLFLEDPRHTMMWGMMDRALAQDLIQLLVREEVFIEGCAGYLFRHFHDRVEEYRNEDRLLLNDPNLHYIPELVRFNVLDYSLLDKMTPEDLELMKQGYRNFQWFMKTFIDAGGKILVGQDVTSVNHPTSLPGVATRREIQLLVDAGVSPMKALQAATLWPAQVIGKSKDLGTLEKGKIADLIVLGRNPLDDIAALKNVEKVMQAGRWLPVGYHYYFRDPIPWPPGDEISYPGFGPISEIPQRINSLSPQAVAEGSNDFTLTIRGRDFVSTATVQFGDRLLETEWVGPDELRATVPAELVKTVGSYPVMVIHRLPGVGETNTVYLIVKFR